MGMSRLAVDDLCCSAGDIETEAIVNGLVGRTTAVRSGEFQIHVKMGVGVRNRVDVDRQETILLSPGSWRIVHRLRRQTGLAELTRVSHGGKYIQLYAPPASIPQNRDQANVDYPKNRTWEEDLFPEVLGTLWHEAIVDYVRARVADAKSKGSEVLDGVETQVVEWPVPIAERDKGFYWTNKVLEGGGTLRLNVAPQLGYVLPRIQMIGAQGAVGCSVTSSGFTEVTPGIYYPEKCRLQYYDADGAERSYRAFSEIKASRVNEAIPDSDYELQLRPGTSITDARQEEGAVGYHLTQQTSSNELDKLSAKFRRGR
jgi:hypothetical protein